MYMIVWNIIGVHVHVLMGDSAFCVFILFKSFQYIVKKKKANTPEYVKGNQYSVNKQKQKNDQQYLV